MDEFETVTVDSQGVVIQRQRLSCLTRREDLGNGVFLELVQIPTGIFMMGSPGQGGYADEKPPHHVRVAAFLLGKTPVTQGQWQAVMHKERPWRCPGENRPVDRVNWKDASAFCAQLARKTGRAYRLPGEAEWEYACRAGTHGPFAFGATLTTDLANYVGDHTYQQEPRGVYRHGSTDVGSFPPNAFGLVDMHGNVWEWCADDWYDDYEGASFDGSARVRRGGTGDKVMRGGSWHEPPINCRSATRLKMQQDEAEDFFGFRVALNAFE